MGDMKGAMILIGTVAFVVVGGIDLYQGSNLAKDINLPGLLGWLAFIYCYDDYFSKE